MLRPRWMLAMVVWAAAAASPGAAGQSQLVVSQDFERGLGGWTVSGNNPFGTPKLLWHVAPDGECDAVTAMAAFNRAPMACDYGFATFGTLSSPVFTLPGADSFVLRFEYMRDMDPLDGTTVLIGNPFQGYTVLVPTLDNSASPSTYVVESHALGDLVGTPVRLAFDAIDLTGHSGFGWMVDEISFRTGAWTDLGASKSGSTGTPALSGSGLLEPGSVNALHLEQASPLSGATLVAGLSALNAPFKGGTMVPFPSALVMLTTSATGTIDLGFTWPAAVPAGTVLYVQYWISDAGASAGFSASNGLKGVTTT